MIDTIDARMAAIEEILAKVPGYTKELDELHMAKRVILRFSGDTIPEDTFAQAWPQQPALGPVGAPLGILTKAYLASRQLTTKQAILRALAESIDPWVTASALQELTSKIKGTDVPMATLSPTLTNMRNDGLIRREGLHVALPSRVDDDRSIVSHWRPSENG